MRSFILFSALLTGLTAAVAPPIPRPTDPLVGGVDLRGFTPKPTTAPVFGLDLKNRAAAATSSPEFLGWFGPDNTCGYVDGLVGGIKTCETDQICAGLEVQGVATMGCCDTFDDLCTWYGNCVGYDGYWSSSLCGPACQNDINTVKCTDVDYPYCYSFMVPGVSIGWYSCASTFFSEFVEFDTTYIGENDGRSWTKVYNTLTSSNGLDLTVTESSNAFHTGNIATTAGSGGSASTVTVTPSNKSKSTPVAAIAGGVVGGVVAIGAVLAGVLWFCLRQRKQNKDQTAANEGSAAAATTPGQGPAPDMAQQHPQVESVYGAPGGYQPPPQNPPQGLASDYYGPGKQDYMQNPQNPYDPTMAAKIHGSPQITQQEMHAPVSPAPPYSQVIAPAGGISPAGSPPPNVQEMHAQMPTYGQYQNMQQNMGGVPPNQPPVQELPTQFATTLHNAEGQPIYEAPDQLYRSIQ